MIVAIAPTGAGVVQVEEFRVAVDEATAVNDFVNEYSPPLNAGNYIGFDIDQGSVPETAPDTIWGYDHASPGLVPIAVPFEFEPGKKALLSLSWQYDQLRSTDPTYSVEAVILFPGTDVLGPVTKSNCVARSADLSTIGSLKVVDITNGGLTILEYTSLSSNDVDQAFALPDPVNLPVGQAAFEVQLRRGTGTGNKAIWLQSLNFF